MMSFYSSPRLLIIDELGYLPLPAEGAAALFQVVTQRYLKASTAITTNLGIASWAKVTGDRSRGQAMLTVYCTAASYSTSRALPTGCGRTGPGPRRPGRRWPAMADEPADARGPVA